MAWHGTSKAQTGKVFLSEDQWLALARLAENSEYWKTANDFMNGLNGCLLSSLTIRQIDWYDDIYAKLDVEVNRHEGRIAFGLEKEDE